MKYEDKENFEEEVQKLDKQLDGFISPLWDKLMREQEGQNVIEQIFSEDEEQFGVN